MAKKLVISVLIVLVANFLWASASPVKDTVSTYTAEEKADQAHRAKERLRLMKRMKKMQRLRALERAVKRMKTRYLRLGMQLWSEGCNEAERAEEHRINEMQIMARFIDRTIVHITARAWAFWLECIHAAQDKASHVCLLHPSQKLVSQIYVSRSTYTIIEN